MQPNRRTTHGLLTLALLALTACDEEPATQQKRATPTPTPYRDTSQYNDDYYRNRNSNNGNPYNGNNNTPIITSSTLPPPVSQQNGGLSEQTALVIGQSISQVLGSLGPNTNRQTSTFGSSNQVNYVEKDCNCPPTTEVSYGQVPCGPTGQVQTTQSTQSSTTVSTSTQQSRPTVVVQKGPTSIQTISAQSQSEILQQAPAKQSGSNACADPVNQNVELPAPARMKPNTFGHINCALLSPLTGRGPHLGQPYAYFSDLPRPDNEVPGDAKAGVYFHSGFVRKGKKVLGSLGLRNDGGAMVAAVTLNSGEEIRVGRVTEIEKSTTYPRRARIDFDFGACITQYLTTDGHLFSAGAGYIILP